MTSTYELSELTPLLDAAEAFIHAGVPLNIDKLRREMKKGTYPGRKVGRDWYILTSTVTKLCKEQAS